jgi:hypothetical protein
VLNLHAGQPTNVLPLRKKRANDETLRVEEKHPIDQWNNEDAMPAARKQSARILQKFGEPPKIRRFLFSNTPLLASSFCHPTDPSDISSQTRVASQVGALLAWCREKKPLVLFADSERKI